MSSSSQKKKSLRKKRSVRRKSKSLKRIIKEQKSLKEKIESQQRLLNQMNQHQDELERQSKYLSKPDWEKDILSQVDNFKKMYSKPYMWTLKVLKLYVRIDYLNIVGFKKVNDDKFQFCYYEPANRTHSHWRKGNVDYNVNEQLIPNPVGYKGDEFSKNLLLLEEGYENNYKGYEKRSSVKVDDLLELFPTENSKAISFSRNLEVIKDKHSLLWDKYMSCPNIQDVQPQKYIEFNLDLLKKTIEIYRELISESQQYKKWWIEDDFKGIKELEKIEQKFSKYLSRISQEEGKKDYDNQLTNLKEQLGDLIDMDRLDFIERIGSVLAEASGFVGPPLHPFNFNF